MTPTQNKALRIMERIRIPKSHYPTPSWPEVLEVLNDLIGESTRQQKEITRLRQALGDVASVAWRINDTADRSEGDRYYFASTNDWDDLHEALHRHADVIRQVE